VKNISKKKYGSGREMKERLKVTKKAWHICEVILRYVAKSAHKRNPQKA